jgi:hypothetical protein
MDASLAGAPLVGLVEMLDKVVESDAAPERLLNMAYAFWHSKALFAAVELDVFTHLADGPLNLDTLIARTGIHPRGARDFFDALVALRLLDRDAHGRYANLAESDHFLVRHKPCYLGDLFKHFNERHYKNWDSLTRALVTGEPQSTLGTGSYIGLYADESKQAIFLNGMTAGSLLSAQALAHKFPWARYRTFVDVGTAQGCVPVEIALAHPHLRGTGYDLAAVEPAFVSYVSRHGLLDRLQFHPGDFFVDPLPQADVLVMGRILHNWGEPSRIMLLNKAYQAIAPGGALIVYDPFIEDERLRKPHGLLSSLNMLIETSEGSEYTASECKDWMARSGFIDMRFEPLDDLHTVVIGIKAGA